jgi:hypothetical protein
MKTLMLLLVVSAALYYWHMPHTPQERMQAAADAECDAVLSGSHAVNVGVYFNGHQMTHGTWCSR